MVAKQSYRERRPHGALGDAVAVVWRHELPTGAAAHLHRTVPNGSVELLCRVGEVPEIRGPRTSASVDLLEPGTTTVGVRFRPGAAPGVPVGELVDAAVGVDALWGRSAAELGERIALAGSADEALGLLETAVASRLAAAAPPDPVVREAVGRLMPWRGTEVGSLPRALHVSERQLRRRCGSAIGVAPKVLQRMLRFQGFLALVQSGASGTGGLARLAADAGYADQAHLGRECLRLSGLPPGVFLREIAHQCGPTHDHAASFLPLLRGRRRG